MAKQQDQYRAHWYNNRVTCLMRRCGDPLGEHGMARRIAALKHLDDGGAPEAFHDQEAMEVALRLYPRWRETSMSKARRAEAVRQDSDRRDWWEGDDFSSEARR